MYISSVIKVQYYNDNNNIKIIITTTTTIIIIIIIINTINLFKLIDKTTQRLTGIKLKLKHVNN